MRFPRSSAALALVLALALTPAGAGAGVVTAGVVAAPDSVDKSDNVTAVDRKEFTGGTEIAWDGDFLYVGQMNGKFNRNTVKQGGVLIYNVAEDAPRLVGKIECHGTDNDVMLVRSGLIAVAHHSTQSCPAKAGGVSPKAGNGIYLVDVSNVNEEGQVLPRITGSVNVASAHTLTVHPTKPYIYVSGGGLANGPTSIVDISDETKPTVKATFSSNVLDCHDLQFKIEANRDLVFCAGFGEIQTWDVTNVTAPKVIGHIVNPGIQFPHNAVVSPDGKLLVINDEAFGAHECVTGTSVYGSLWVYDISIPEAPILAGRVAPPTARQPLGTYTGWVESWCAAHNYNFIPGTRILTSAWFAGGITVEDLSNPLLPKRLAHYKPGDGVAYTSHWYDGRIFVTDMARGLETLKVAGLEEPPAQGPVADSRSQGDLTDVLVTPEVVARSGARPQRSAANSAFCVIPKAGSTQA